MLLELIRYAVTFRLKGTDITCKEAVEYDRLRSIIRDRNCDIWEPAHKGCSIYEEWFSKPVISEKIFVSSFTLVYHIKTERNIYLAIRISGDDYGVDKKDGIELYNMETHRDIWIPDDTFTDYDAWNLRVKNNLFRSVEDDSIRTWMPYIEEFIHAIRTRRCPTSPIRTMVELLAKPELDRGKMITQMGHDLAKTINNRFSWLWWSEAKSKSPAELKEYLEDFAVHAVAEQYLGDCNTYLLKKALKLMGYKVDPDKAYEDITPVLTEALQDDLVKLERDDWLTSFGLRYFI